jgi:hypothetical protein
MIGKNYVIPSKDDSNKENIRPRQTNSKCAPVSKCRGVVAQKGSPPAVTLTRESETGKRTISAVTQDVRVYLGGVQDSLSFR